MSSTPPLELHISVAVITLNVIVIAVANGLLTWLGISFSKKSVPQRRILNTIVVTLLCGAFLVQYLVDAGFADSKWMLLRRYLAVATSIITCASFTHVALVMAQRMEEMKAGDFKTYKSIIKTNCGVYVCICLTYLVMNSLKTYEVLSSDDVSWATDLRRGFSCVSITLPLFMLLRMITDSTKETAEINSTHKLDRAQILRDYRVAGIASVLYVASLVAGYAKWKSVHSTFFLAGLTLQYTLSAMFRQVFYIKTTPDAKQMDGQRA